MGSPWAFHPHVGAWVVLGASGLAYALATTRPRWRAVPGERLRFGLGLAVLVVALSPPLGDVAAHWSLTALVLQRLLLLLAAPALLLAGTPKALLADLTRPRAVDAALRLATRPVVAVALVTVVAVGTLVTPAVGLQASSAAVRGGFDLALVLAGLVLWAPVSHRLPGTERPSALGQAGYLVVQSIVPSFLAIVWIFSRHPLYPPYAHARFLGMAPLTDQQLAGFCAKLLTIAALWTVALVVVLRAERDESEDGGGPPLTWADVERQLERAERDRRRHGVRQSGDAG